MSGERTGVYPGTFDPITNGHLDIISRATRVVDRLVIAVAANAGKAPLFDVDERVAMAREAVDNLDHGNSSRIEVQPFDTLLVDFARDCAAGLIVRGLRAASDFEYEFQMAAMNSRLAPGVETVFLTASERCQFISSRFVKEIGALGGDISGFVPPAVEARVRARHGREHRQSEAP